MTKYLLDTNAVSEAVKSRHNPGYMTWLNDTADELMYISCLTIGEIQKGVSLVDANQLPKQLKTYVPGLLNAFTGRLLTLDIEDCLYWGKLLAASQKAGRTPPMIDSLLAAQALRQQFTLVTRNIKDFQQFADLELLCPWTD